jgi:hypothetical protein
LGSSKILQGGRSHSQSKIFPVGRVEPEAVFGHFKLNLDLLSFEMPFWQPGTFEELDLDWLEDIRMNWNTYEGIMIQRKKRQYIRMN